MDRRRVLARLAIGGAGAVVARSALSAPLRRVTVALLDGEAAAAACGQDTCTVRDACLSGDAGHACHERDACAIDESGDCTRDECTQSDASNSGAACTDDSCASDSSGACSTDTCTGDSSNECDTDACTSDRSGSCAADTCESDKSGSCTTDACVSDSSGGCTNDECESDASKACQSSDTCDYDSSGECAGDVCSSDSSGECAGDTCTDDASGGCSPSDDCVADASGGCTGADACTSDSSGECRADECSEDKSGACGEDVCVADHSGACTANDTCLSDSSKGCGADECASDASGACDDDGCRADSSGACAGDRCASDSSAECTQADVCVLDSSQSCVSDLCRRDADPAPCTTDSCAPDLLAITTRRTFTRLGRALRWLYEIGAALALCLLAAAARHAAAQTVIDTGCNATFFPRAVALAATPVSPGAPKGAFLADFDGDGELEADTDGDGLDAADPEVADRDGDGTRDLPPGTTFAGTRRYTVFWVPDDVVIAATGFLKVMVTSDARVFGALRLAAGAEIAARGVVDVRSSAWLSETGEVRLTSARTGGVDSGTCAGVATPPDDPVGHVVDSDQDGALDADEGAGDADGDGSPDWLDQDTATLPSPEGTGAVAADLAEGPEQRLDFTAASVVAAADPSLPTRGRPAAGVFLFGVHELRAEGLEAGETIALAVHLPIPAPVGAELWRIDGTRWLKGTLGSDDGDATVTVALTDGGEEDLDGAVDGGVRFRGAVAVFARGGATPVRRRVGGTP